MPREFFNDVFEPEVAQEFSAAVEEGGLMMSHCTRITKGAGSHWYLLSLKKAGNEVTATVHIDPFDVEGTRKALMGHINQLVNLGR